MEFLLRIRIMGIFRFCDFINSPSSMKLIKYNFVLNNFFLVYDNFSTRESWVINHLVVTLIVMR